jgi:holo-[acyl-carrier protein] synthase
MPRPRRKDDTTRLGNHSTMVAMEIIGHGVDVVSIARIAQMLSEHGERFVERCFTDAERDYANAGPRRRAERLAVRFACKEAVMKALGTGWRSGISWRDIEVLRRPSGQPKLVLTGRCAELAAQMRIARWHVSMSHSDELAMASVIASS